MKFFIEKDYALCKIIGDTTNTTFITTGLISSIGSTYTWVGKEIITGTPIIVRHYKDVTDAAKEGIKKGKLIANNEVYITKSEALEKIKELSESHEKAVSYIQAIKEVKPRYVEIIKIDREQTKERNAEERNNNKQLTKSIRRLTSKLRNIN